MQAPLHATAIADCDHGLIKAYPLCCAIKPVTAWPPGPIHHHAEVDCVQGDGTPRFAIQEPLRLPEMPDQSSQFAVASFTWRRCVKEYHAHQWPPVYITEILNVKARRHLPAA